ncbi:MAG TPA: ribonuclease HI [Clostridia bacterium]|nr:ribonuclease HI [Clostridia bacterium]
MNNRKRVKIYTDGACSGNPGAGGWGAVLIYNSHIKEVSGGEGVTTNNRMELAAAINGLEALLEPCDVDLYSDSTYLIKSFNENRLNTWLNNGWKTAGKQPVKNIDLWQRLLELSKLHRITWHKVKGHSDNEYNNRCDALARAAIISLNKP